MRFDRGCGLNRLETSRISRASATQRAGRAGRQGPGRCLRLWTEAENSSLRDAESPEIRRLELSRAVLQLKSWGEHDLEAFGWFEKPPQRALDDALELLRSLGAVERCRTHLPRPADGRAAGEPPVRENADRGIRARMSRRRGMDCRGPQRRPAGKRRHLGSRSGKFREGSQGSRNAERRPWTTDQHHP